MAILDMQFKRDFNELDPNKKDAEWANKIISVLRAYMAPLVDNDEENDNKAYLYGRQSTERYSKKFKRKTKKQRSNKPGSPKEEREEMEFDFPFKFITLKLMAKVRNILTAELQKAGIYLQLKAEDPTATKDRDYDQSLLRNANKIEQVLSQRQTSMGLPPYKLSQAKDEQGNKVSRGNIEDFKELGLDASKPEDVSYFFKTHYRLDVEIAAESVVNYYVKKCRLEDNLVHWGDDFMAYNAIAHQVYANESSNSPESEYLSAKNVQWIKGNDKDGRDAAAIMWEKSMTMAEVISRLGVTLNDANLFDFLEVANQGTAKGQGYDGVYWMDGESKVPYPSTCRNAIRVDNFLSLKVKIGYVEWKSQDGQALKTGVNSYGQFRADKIDLDYNLSERSKSTKEAFYAYRTYKAYFLPTSTNTQKVFKFGKLYDMRLEGDYDELSCFSIQVYKEDGPPVVEVAKPYIDNIHDGWYRFCWIVNKVKPAGTNWNIDSLAAAAEIFFADEPEDKLDSQSTRGDGQAPKENKITRLLEMFYDSPDTFYSNMAGLPNVQNPHFPLANGVDKAAKELLDIIEVNKAKINEELGLNDLRQAVSPTPDVSFKTQAESLASSRNATYYINYGILQLLKGAALNFVSIVQDKIRYKGTKEFDNIELALGSDTVESIKLLEKLPLYKLGIFIESFNTAADRQLFLQDLYLAFQQKQVPFEVYTMLKGIPNPKKAAQILAYEKSKAQAREEQQVQQAQQNQMALIEREEQKEINVATVKGQLEIQREKVRSEGYVAAAQIAAQQEINLKQFLAQVEPAKQNAKVDAQIRKAQAEHDIGKEEPVPTELI